MIGALKGVVLGHGRTTVLLNVNGVGYKVAVTPPTMEHCAVGNTVFLRTHLVVREDALELFGFLTQDELDFFELLLNVSGIGPRSALGIIALGHLDKVKSAIAASDIGYLTNVSGIGKKSAEKIILELKDKLAHLAGTHGEHGQSDEEDVLEALKALGYSLSEARSSLAHLPPSAHTTGERVREALRYLTNNNT